MSENAPDAHTYAKGCWPCEVCRFCVPCQECDCDEGGEA